MEEWRREFKLIPAALLSGISAYNSKGFEVSNFHSTGGTMSGKQIDPEARGRI